MDTRFLESFLTVVDRGSIAEAARRLNLTAAAVAQRIRTLESEIDAAIIVEPPFAIPKSCEWRVVREEPLIVLAPAAMGKRDPHDLLANEPFIRYDHNNWTGQLVDKYLRRAGIRPHERFEL